MNTSIKAERHVGSRATGYFPTGYQVGKYSAANREGNCIIEMPLWYFKEAMEELRMTMFKFCNSELQIKRKRRQLRWPNAYDHREVIQSNGVAALARHKYRHFPGEGQGSRHRNRLIYFLFRIICLNANIHDTILAVLKKISHKKIFEPRVHCWAINRCVYFLGLHLRKRSQNLPWLIISKCTVSRKVKEFPTITNV
jgi:hypothetical protein